MSSAVSVCEPSGNRENTGDQENTGDVVSAEHLRLVSGSRSSLDAFEGVADVVGSDLSVPLVTGESIRYANLDYAASAPALSSVAADLNRVLPYYASVHRGTGYTSQICSTLYENSRSQIASFAGARDDDLTIITRNTTDALNLLASALPADATVVCLDIEHHANLLPWQQLGATIVPAAGTIGDTLDHLDRALSEQHVDLLTITAASNVTGELLPLDRLADLAHRHGARLAVDGAQLAGHRRINIAESGIDYLAFSAHKCYAPYGAGVLIGRADWLDTAQPYLAGGGAVRRVTTHATEWTIGAARHEGGTPNVLGAVALASACRTIAAITDNRLRRHEGRLRTRLLSRLVNIPGIDVLAIWSDSREAVGVVGFTVAGYSPGLVASYLSAEHGIGVRDGAFCAHPLLDRLDATNGALRASFGLGTRSEDVDRLVDALQLLIRNGPLWDYALVNGRYQPSPDPRPAPSWLQDLGAAELARPELDGTELNRATSPCQQ